MATELIATADGKGLRVAVVVARFNAFVTERLLAGARAALETAGVEDDAITIVRVPGAFEIPYAAELIAAEGQVDAIVALGAVIRGDTPHFDYVCDAATDGCRDVMLRYKLPIAFGVLTTNDVEQALVRSEEGDENKGGDAVRTALEMARLGALVRG